MFELHKLGWQRFQQLCLTVSREVLGQTVQSFLDSNDGGRDGAFTGVWNPRKNEQISGQFVVQCKFTSRQNHALRTTELGDEIEKVRRLVQEGRCDAYILMTNAGISGRTAERVETMLKRAGVKWPICFGADWICQQIQESQRLRMLVPHVYGLGDLSQILDKRAYDQAQKLLASLHDDLSKVVITRSYQRAARALRRHGFVLLLGEPASGKTTIAAMLAMAAIDRWGALVLKLDEPNKVVDHWNPQEPSQFFWIDDAFGTTQYESTLAWGWNHVFAQAKAAILNGAKIVMTSRDYIYNRARYDLKETAFPLLKESQVVIDLHTLTADERQQILYNHVRLGRQPRTFRARIKPHLETVSALPQFVPEVARRLGDPVFTKHLNLTEREIIRFVEKKEQFLREMLNGIDSDSKAALALIFMRNGNLASPVELNTEEIGAMQRMGSDLGRCTMALSALNSSLVRYTVESGQAFWKFKHPTIGDAFAALLLENPELMGIYLRTAPADELVYQVTCGDVGLEHAVIVPQTLFPIIHERLDGLEHLQRDDKLPVSWPTMRKIFLARRCDREFLKQYLSKHPEILNSIKGPYPPFDGDSEVDLLGRLFEFGLLPEETRREFINQASEYAIEGEDASALKNTRIRKMFRAGELRHVLDELRTDLMPRLAQVRRRWEGHHERGDDPEGHMEGFVTLLDVLEKEFSGDPGIAQTISLQRNFVNSWIADNLPEENEDQGPPPRLYSSPRAELRPSHERSIFDDVDA
jgi:energy-coupling factor transporter ATP-binding protein EcfA2